MVDKSNFNVDWFHWEQTGYKTEYDPETNQTYPYVEYNTIIIGSGAAGLNCALHLVEEGVKPSEIAILTEKLGSGTSFNTGSDKQTYYKLSIIGNQVDSPIDMAQTFTAGGAMHGDIALIEVTNSIREFFHLIQLGVLFPHDKFGGYVGYKTDNDPKQRATSIGPLTSQMMGNCLFKAVKNYKIPIYNKLYATRIIIDNSNERPEACGVIGIYVGEDMYQEANIWAFKSRNIIIATGGPSFLYKNTVYPPSQFGSTALAILAGCKLQNLTESQFGLASIKFRWNVSGSYMQVIPRFISIDSEGNKNEFLNNYFPSFQELSKAIFLKGYQWPFNSDRIENLGSSLIDLAVYHETEVLGKKVYLDFTKNPSNYSDNEIDPVAKEYLTNTNSLGETPIERLEKLNQKAIDLYLSHEIDIRKEPLQIALCNQHLNGGISGDIWWETSVKHLFAIGEINGSHGVHRPGGAALNSGQVGGLRAAQKIAHEYYKKQTLDQERFKSAFLKYNRDFISELESGPLKDESPESDQIDFTKIIQKLHNRMSKFGAAIRPLEGIEQSINEVKNDLVWLNEKYRIPKKIVPWFSDEEVWIMEDLLLFFRIQDALLTQLFFLHSIYDYHLKKGGSRGSYLILRNEIDKSLNERKVIPPGELARYAFIKSENTFKDQLQTVLLNERPPKTEINTKWEPVREIPKADESFEVVWKKFNDGIVFQ